MCCSLYLMSRRQVWNFLPCATLKWIKEHGQWVHSGGIGYSLTSFYHCDWFLKFWLKSQLALLRSFTQTNCWPHCSWYSDFQDLWISPPWSLSGRIFHCSNGKSLIHNRNNILTWPIPSNISDRIFFSDWVASCIIQSRRCSTSNVYDDRWRIFCGWSSR